MTKEQKLMNKGAALERRAMRAWLKRRLTQNEVGYTATDVLLVLDEFVKHRRKRVSAKVGGLGRR